MQRGATIPAMVMGRRTHLFAAWVACFAILLAALAPSISHAVAARHAALAATHEICTTEGLHAAPEDASAAEGHHAPEGGMAHMEHCPFCLSNAGPPALLPAGFSLPVVAGSRAAPRLYYQSPRPLFAWAAAQPRGPPA